VYRRLGAAQLGKPRENSVDDAIAADAHKWKCTFCVCPKVWLRLDEKAREASGELKLLCG
jgi:hypothetical protein